MPAQTQTSKSTSQKTHATTNPQRAATAHNSQALPRPIPDRVAHLKKRDPMFQPFLDYLSNNWLVSSAAMTLKGKYENPLIYPPSIVWQFPKGLIDGGMSDLSPVQDLERVVYERTMDPQLVANLWPILRVMLHTNIQNHYWTAEVLTTLVLSVILINSAEAGWSLEETYVKEKGKS